MIDSAKSELDLLSYSFSSVPVVEALVRARHRGVKVKLVADYKDNVSTDRSGKARAALGALVNAGADVRTISVYAMMGRNKKAPGGALDCLLSGGGGVPLRRTSGRLIARQCHEFLLVKSK